MFLADRVLTANDNVWGDTLLAVSINPRLLEDWTIVEDGMQYREWLVPAALLNASATVSLAGETAEPT